MPGLEGSLALLLLLAAVALWWVAAINARDRARAFARGLCKRQGWQLLDQTVTLVGLWPVRGERGWQLVRRYRFDFSPDGGHRRHGELTLNGRQLQRIWAELEDGGRLIE